MERAARPLHLVAGGAQFPYAVLPSLDPATWTAMLDRSPCGSGTCAVMACLHARGELALGERFVHEGIVGATFEGTLRGETTVGGLRAVLPSVTGRAWITQHCTVVVDATDPFPTGFTVGDIWAS